MSVAVDLHAPGLFLFLCLLAVLFLAAALLSLVARGRRRGVAPGPAHEYRRFGKRASRERRRT